MVKVLDINALNEETLTTTIQKMIENPKYAQRAKEMSQLFRDRPMSPLDTAVWWTEYALRNRNISRMRLNVEEIPLIQYYAIDSILTFGFRFGLIAVSVFFLGYSLFHKSRVRQRFMR